MLHEMKDIGKMDRQKYKKAEFVDFYELRGPGKLPGRGRPYS